MTYKRERHLAGICWGLSILCALLALALLVCGPEISILSQPDGRHFLYINRDVDLPTGDPAHFTDYSILPLCGAVAACAVFYLFTGALLWGRQAEQQSPSSFQPSL